ncbi:MAG: TorF family putative porin [Opitutales bacterium]
MNKTITSMIAALGVATAANAQELSITSTVGYESVYVFRGAELADDIFHGSVDIAFGDFYTGIWTAQPITGGQDNEIDFYAGYGFAASDLVSLDFGGTVYYYPEAGAGADETTFEAYIGAAFDVVLSPAVYLYYDVDLEVFTLEGSGGYSVEISDSTSFDLGAYLGYIEPDEGDGQYYLGATADVSYSFTENASGSIGIRVSDLEDGDSEFYWGASFSAGF